MQAPSPGSSPVERVREGDPQALAELMDESRPRLLRMVALRLEPSLRGRIDPVDVLQEAALEALRRFPEWLRQDSLPIHLWLRLITAQSLAQVHRRHLGAHMRDALREARGPAGLASCSAASAADAFVASSTSPTMAARRGELRARVLQALEELDELDREIVVLRHYEGLTNDEAAAELGISSAAASKRFLRALVRLRPALLGLLSESAPGPS